MTENIDCQQHGPQQATYVCCHLAESIHTRQAMGFYYSSEPYGDAWCSACEQIRIREGGSSGDWNERSEEFANITLLCSACYDEIRKINGF